MSDPTFGLSITSINNEPRPAITANMSIVGLVGLAEDADADDFPLNTPVQIYSDDTAALAKLGAGTLYDAISAINEQLGVFQVAAQCIVVRVAEGASVPETIANLRGDVNAGTGMWALQDAPHELGLTPRLICVPGYTSQAVNQIGAVTVTSGGTGYTSAPTVAFTGGGSDAGKVLPTGVAVLGTGADEGKVVSVTVTNKGANLTAAPVIAFTGGVGTGAAATTVLDTASNAIVASLPSLLDSLLAVAVVDGPSSTQTAALNWRATISSRRIIPVDPAYKVLDAEGDIVTKPKAPYVIGIGVRRDHEFAGRPFHSWANQAVNGIVGTARPIPFSLLDGANEGQTLLAQNIGVTVRGERTDGAIADGGYVFIGTDTCSDDVLWQFYNQVRGRDYIHLIFIKTLRYYLGKFNISLHTIQAVLNTMEFALRDLKATDDILGYRVGFARDKNSPENLRLGKFTVSFAAEEPAPLRYLGIESARYRPALDTLLSDLLAQLDANA